MYQKGKTINEMRLEFNAPNACKRWTKIEEDDMIKELRAGFSHEDISQKHGRTMGGICIRLQDIAIKMMNEEGKSLKDVSNFTKLDENRIQESIMRRKNKKSPPKKTDIDKEQHNDIQNVDTSVMIMNELQDIKEMLHNLFEKINI